MSSNNFHTPWDTSTGFSPTDMEAPIKALDQAITYLKNVLLSCDGDITADKDSGLVTWSGNLRILFSNAMGTIVQNTVAAGTITLAVGEYMYVDLNEVNGTIINMAKTAPTAGTSAAPIAVQRLVIAYRNAISGEFYLANVLSKLAAGNETPGVKTVALASGITAVPGNLLYLTSSGYALADNTALETIQDVVICKVGGTGTCVVVVVEYGYYVHAAGGLTVGPVYVGIAGAFTQTAPTASGSYIKCVGFAIDANTIKFMPDTYEVKANINTLDGLTDVEITTPTVNQVLGYDADTQTWKNIEQSGSGGSVPAGGTAGQVLTKVNDTNYNTQWTTPSCGSSGSVNLWQLLI